jgi:hypothetical protein
MLYELPKNCLDLIYDFDMTFHRYFNLVLLELDLYWKHHRILRNVVLTFHRENLLFKYYVEENLRVLVGGNPRPLI